MRTSEVGNGALEAKETEFTQRELDREIRVVKLRTG